MRFLIVIPARGGSKGIPRKNIKPFDGKPLINYTIDCARAIAKDEDICVSTDDDEIIQVVENYGLKVPFKRPAELATDTAGTYEVLLHALDFYESKGNQALGGASLKGAKFEVYNVSGKKIFYQKCNINNYMKKLKDKNLKKKSILINKKEEFVDNSEWDKLYDIINKIAKKSDNKAFNTDNKKKFNIKNIESFKKKGKKILVKNNKSKK